MKLKIKAKNSTESILLWILSLAALAVGARNFEEGLSLDGPLYATIARTIARTGELFYMDGFIPDFQPYAEHPHLGFWLHALLFKFLPMADWVARIPSHLFYISFLILFFHWLRYKSGEWVATVAVLLLWIWPVFSNYFSNFYLDPGALFFGVAALVLFELALEYRMPLWALFSGALLGLCTLYKGLTVLGFAPIFAYLSLRPTWVRRRLQGFDYFSALLCVFGMAVIVGIYVFTIRQSSVPNFLEIYWERQVTSRFGKSPTLLGFFNWRFLWQLLKDTHFLLPLGFFAFRTRGQGAALALVSLLSFYALYSPTQRIGGQYWLMTLPWVAWLVALGLEQLLNQFRLSAQTLRKFTLRASLLLVVLIQYGPFPTHSRKPPGQIPAIEDLKKTMQVKSLVMGLPAQEANFVSSASFAWYADLRVSYNLDGEDLSVATPEKLYLNFDKNLRSDADFTLRGWCLDRRYEETSLWKDCSV